ncbi:potassium transporter Kup [Casimicrobium huifangae]|uniref:potassium transporter Kup n=1 Tax=Casimicrobium huifangae TaxID=2591109 RepID=UPI0012EC9778|nr:KUP/HAK/KT family potassium transporter [Casimicrobium huifangae]
MNQQSPVRSGTAALTLAALGVVYGDIGTSPLYAFKEAFSGPHAMALNQQNVLAALSAVFWAVTCIISVKYVWLVLRFDNDGEGGVLALTALTHRLAERQRASTRMLAIIATLGVFAAALFYGDALITPAISVLSAVEGLGVATPHVEKFVVPITIGVLIALFSIQRFGTGRVGALFGPITCLWFLVIGVLGLQSIIETPVVLQALNPLYAIDFAIGQPGKMFVLLAAVFLALTGGEALYADMGHFGARAVRIAWFGLVCPALMLNYFGQGALVLRDPAAIKNPFYLLAPDSLLLALVVLATAATVIASQATISGAFSITQQASRLGYLPRIGVRHTSDRERGQIYVGSVNWIMLLGVLLLVLEFRSSSALAAAYGIAVSGTMIITSILVAIVLLLTAGRSRLPLLALLALFVVLESGFLASNLSKVADGGWFPLLFGSAVFLLLMTWKKGSSLVARQRSAIDLPVQGIAASVLQGIPRVPGTAIYLASDRNLVPSALFHNLKHYHVLHEHLILVHVRTEEVPYVEAGGRLQLDRSEPGLLRIDVRFGFREEPDLLAALASAASQGVGIDPMTTTYFIARSVVQDGPGELSAWRCALYAWMTRQAEGAAAYFRLPPNRVVELGTQVLL